MKISSGLTNFRDIGGYATADGKTVRKGRIFRGAALFGLNEENKAFVDKLGLKTVLDLRSQNEVDAAPDEVPFGARYVHSSGILSLDDAPGGPGGNLDMRGLLMSSNGGEGVLAQLQQYMLGGYREMALHPTAFSTAFQLLLQPDGAPLFFHCTAGKDRTGVCAAYILRVLGVPMETVMEDYMASNHHRKQVVEEALAQLRQKMGGDTAAEAMRAMLTVHESYLAENFAVIDETYGGFEEFQQQALGLAPADVAALKEAYLEA